MAPRLGRRMTKNSTTAAEEEAIKKRKMDLAEAEEFVAKLPVLEKGDCQEPERDECILKEGSDDEIRKLHKILTHLSLPDIVNLHSDLGYEEAIRVGKMAVVPNLVPEHMLALTFSPMVNASQPTMAFHKRKTMDVELAPVISRRDYHSLAMLDRSDMRTPFFDLSLGGINSAEKNALNEKAAQNGIEINFPDQESFLPFGTRSKAQSTGKNLPKPAQNEIANVKSSRKNTRRQIKKEPGVNHVDPSERRVTRSMKVVLDASNNQKRRLVREIKREPGSSNADPSQRRETTTMAHRANNTENQAAPSSRRNGFLREIKIEPGLNDVEMPEQRAKRSTTVARQTNSRNMLFREIKVEPGLANVEVPEQRATRSQTGALKAKHEKEKKDRQRPTSRTRPIKRETPDE